MSAVRPLLASALLALLLVAQPVAADLTVDARPGSTYHIYTRGSSSLAAPQNSTITGLWGGYFVNWQAPLATDTVTGYTVYRLPAPNSPGGLQVFHLGSKTTAFYDRPVGDAIYFVTAIVAGGETIPGRPVSTLDVATNYPHCGVVSVYTTDPYYAVHMSCLFPLA